MERVTGCPAIDDAFTSDWTPKYASHLAKQDAALGARATKDSARAALTALIRAAAGRIQVHPAMTDAWRADAHLPIYDNTFARAGPDLEAARGGGFGPAPATHDLLAR